MLRRERFLVVHGMDAGRWAARYGIEPFSHPCSSCGAELTTTLAFAYETLRGLTGAALPMRQHAHPVLRRASAGPR